MVNVLCVAGTRSELIKKEPVMKVLQKCYDGDFVFIHSGQHCNTNMFKIFMRGLALLKTAENINVGSGSYAEQTARILTQHKKRKIGGGGLIGEVWTSR